MNSNFKDSFYKILADTQLKDKLNKSVTVEEVYNVFKSAGYGEGQEKLEGEIRDVIRNFVKSKDASASEEDLSQVAGGKGPGAIKKMSAAALALMGVASAAATSTHAAPGRFENAKSTVNKYLQDRRTRNMITHATALVGGAGLGAVVMGAGWLLFGGKGGPTQVNEFQSLRNIDIALGRACDMIEGIENKAAAFAKNGQNAKATLDDALGAVKGKITELANDMQGQGLLVRSFDEKKFEDSLAKSYEDANGVAKDLIGLFGHLNVRGDYLPGNNEENAAKGFMSWATGVRVMIQSRLQGEFEVGDNGGVSLKDFIMAKGDKLDIPGDVGNKLFKDTQGGSSTQNDALFADVMTAIGESKKINEGAYTAFVRKLEGLKAFNQSFLISKDNDHVNGMLNWLKAALEDSGNTGAGALLALLSDRNPDTGAKNDESKLEHVETIKGLQSITSKNVGAVKKAVKEFNDVTGYFREGGENVHPALKKFADEIGKLDAVLKDNGLIKYLEAKDDNGRKTALQNLLTAELNSVIGDLTLPGEDAPAIGTTDMKNVETLLQAIDTVAGKVKADAITAASEAKTTATREANEQQDAQKTGALEKAEENFEKARAKAEADYTKVTDATAKVGKLVGILRNDSVELSQLDVDSAAISAIIK